MYSWRLLRLNLIKSLTLLNTGGQAGGGAHRGGGGEEKIRDGGQAGNISTGENKITGL